MRFGFQGICAINRSGSYDEPVWRELNLAADATLDDDSDEIDATTRASRGVKQTARSLFSRSATLSLESEADVVPGNSLTGASNIACLIGASRQRQAVCDLAFFDDAVLDEETGIISAGSGIRGLFMVKMTDQQPMGDRWLNEFEVKPGRVQPGVAAYEGKPVLVLDYEIEEEA